MKDRGFPAAAEPGVCVSCGLFLASLVDEWTQPAACLVRFSRGLIHKSRAPTGPAAT